MPKCVRTAHVFEKKWRSDDVRLQEEADFSSLLLSNKVLFGLENAGYKKPSPIQLEAVPVGLFGRDLLVQAKSGTGKTLVFTIIALETLLDVKHPQVLIVAPTREIAVQIRDVFRAVGSEFSGLKCNSFIGGTPLEEDAENVRGCQIVVGTPGRLKHLISIGIFPTNSIRLIVLDEADVLLSEAFKCEIDFIFQSLPKDKQVIAASATYPTELKYFIQHYFRNVFMARLNRKELTLLGMIHYIYLLQLNKMPLLAYKVKLSALEKVLSSIQFTQCLVFCNLVSRVESLCFDIRNWGFTAAYISSAKEQCDRLRAIDYLKRFKCKILVSSDVTSRGIDAENVDLVINFDYPYNSEVYLHRCGRAGRYGSKGVAITFVTEDEVERFERLKADEHFEAYNLPDPMPLNLINLRPKQGDVVKRKEESSSEDELEKDSVDVISSSNGIVSNGEIILEEDESILSAVDTLEMDEAVLNKTFPTDSIKNCHEQRSRISLLEESLSLNQDECIENDVTLSKDSESVNSKNCVSVIESDALNPVSAESKNNAVKDLQCDSNVKSTVTNGSSEELLKDQITDSIEDDKLEIHKAQSDIQNCKEENVVKHSSSYLVESPLEIKIDEENIESNLSLFVPGLTVPESGQETCADFDYSVDTKKSIQSVVKCNDRAGDNRVGCVLGPVTFDNLRISDCSPTDQKKDTNKLDVSDHQPVSETIQSDNKASAGSQKNCIKEHLQSHKGMNKLNPSCHQIQKGSLPTPNGSSNSAVEIVDNSYLNKLQIPIVKFLMDCEKSKTNCSAGNLHISDGLIIKTTCKGEQKTTEDKSLLSDLTMAEKYENIRKGLNDFYREVFTAYQTKCIKETTFEDLKRTVMSENDIKISNSVEENTKQIGDNDCSYGVKNNVEQSTVQNKSYNWSEKEEKCIPSLKSSFNSKKRNYLTDSSDSDDSTSLAKSDVSQNTRNEDQAFAKYIFNGKRASQTSSSSSDESLKRNPCNNVKKVSSACSKSSEVSLSSISSSELHNGSHHSNSRGSIRKQKMFSSRECDVSKVQAPKPVNLSNLSKNGVMQRSDGEIDCAGEKQFGARRKVFHSGKQSVVKKFNFKQSDSESDSSDSSDQCQRQDTQKKTVFSKRQTCIKTATRNRKPNRNVAPISSSTPYSQESQQNGSSPRNYCASNFQKARDQRERNVNYVGENVTHPNFYGDYYSPFPPHDHQTRAFPTNAVSNWMTSLNSQCSDHQCHRHLESSSCRNNSCAEWYKIFLRQWGFIHASIYPHHR